MTFLSLFAGIGGFDLGLERAGHKCIGQVEIDPHARSVLNRHWPSVPKHDDVSTLTGTHFDAPDLVTFGSPCQDLSIAGKRAGLDGERSGLFMEAMRYIRELRKATNGQSPAFAIWENVPGAFSSNGGRDFAVVLRALAELGALDVSWRVLDSQWFGVPQRRRRIFLVADFGGERAGAVLSLPASLSWDSPPSEEAGESVTGTLEARTRGGGFPGTDFAIAGGVQPVAFAENSRGEVRLEGGDGQRTGALSTGGGKPGQGMPTVAFDWTASASRSLNPAPVAPAMEAQGKTAIAFDTYNQSVSSVSHTLRDPNGTFGDALPAVSSGHAVRRLTPRECERLQGFPDDHTRWDDKGTEIADTHRYRMLGNAVTVNVAQHLGQLIKEAA